MNNIIVGMGEALWDVMPEENWWCSGKLCLSCIAVWL